MSKNNEKLQSFIEFCQKNPGMRFWQALRNWSDFSSILVIKKNGIESRKLRNELVENGAMDTFFWE